MKPVRSIGMGILLVGFGLAGPGRAQAQLLGSEEVGALEGQPVEPAAPVEPVALVQAPAEAPRGTIEVRGFRPEADVNGLENSDICFAISTFVSRFFTRVEFDRTRPRLDGPQAYQSLINHVLGEGPGRFTIGGVSNLVEFTDRARNPGGHWYFKTWCELTQAAGQFATHGPRTAVALVRAYPLPLRLASPAIESLAVNTGFAGAGPVNLDTAAAVQTMLQAGRPAPLCVFSLTGGHCLVAYRVDEFADRFELLCHDVNDPPNLRAQTRLRRIVVPMNGGALRVIKVADGAVDAFYAEWDLIAVADPFRGEALRQFRYAINNPGESRMLNAYLEAVTDQDLATQIAGGLGLARWAGRQIQREVVWAAIDTGTTLVQAGAQLARAANAAAPAVANVLVPGSGPVVRQAIDQAPQAAAAAVAVAPVAADIVLPGSGSAIRWIRSWFD